MKKHWLLIGIIGLLSQFGTAYANTDWSAQDYDLYSGDFNGDGKTDILYVAKDPSKPSGIALSDGTAPNIAWQTWPSNYLNIPWANNQYTVIVADFNGDGKADIFLQSNAPGDNYLLLTDSTGHVIGISQTVPNIAMGLTWSADQHRIIVGNFCGTQKADLFLQATSVSGIDAIICIDANAMIPIYTGPSQTWNDSFLGLNWSTQSANVYAGDFNGDGKADLLVQAKPKFISIGVDDIPIVIPTYPPNMNGVAFSQGGSSPFQLANVQTWSRTDKNVDWSPLANTLTIGDFNGDGKADVLLQAKYSGQTSYVLNGNATVTGTIFSTAPTALSVNVSITLDSAKLIAGNFDGTPGVGLYVQALPPSGTNYFTNTVGATTSVTVHDPSIAIGAKPANAIGHTTGSFSVSNNGAANYSIPITVPPGVAGIQPSLSLTYDSGGGNGLLGVGWSLSGLSQITRCRKTLAQNNVIALPTVSPMDDYCLDGNKLRLVSGAAGTDGAIYQTELETFSRITAVGSFTSGPYYFKVEGKNGLTYEYGHGNQSTDNTLNPSVWMLSKVMDRMGNYMMFTYAYSGDQETGIAVKPVNIVYTANDSNSSYLYPSYMISFIYETRASGDAISRTTMSGAMRDTQRLKQILTQYSDPIVGGMRTVRQYNLTYNASGTSPRSRLSSVQECDGSNNCLSPTTVGWQGAQIGVGSDNSINLGSNANYAIPVDIDGDGRADVVYPCNLTWCFRLSIGNGYAAEVNTGIANNGKFKAIPIDYNSDGKMDLLVADANSNWEILKSTGSGFTVISTSFPATGAGTSSVWTVDVNGDGYQDLVYVNSGGTQLIGRMNSANGFSSATSVLYTAPSGYSIITSQQSGATSYSFIASTQGDFNGDGLMDLMIGLGTGGVATSAAVLLSTGSGFVSSGQTFSGNVANLLNSWRALDVNGDGVTDIAFFDSSNHWQVLYGGPKTSQRPYVFTAATSMAQTYGGQANTELAIDWDGDGRMDLLDAQVPLGLILVGNVYVPNTQGSTWRWIRSTGDTCSVTTCSAVGGIGAMADKGDTGIDSSPSQSGAVAIDINGDGLQDLAYVDANNNWHYRFHNGSSSDLVTSITDGFGNTVNITYSTLADNAVYTKGSNAAFPELDIQAPSQVVKSFSASNGIADPSASMGSYTISETYSGARVNLNGRGIEGFASRVETDSRTGITTTKIFNQLFPFTGSEASVTTRQLNGKMILQKTSHYVDVSVGTKYSNDRHYVYADITTQTNYEVNASNSTADGAGLTQVTTSVGPPDSYGNFSASTVTTADMTSGAPVTVRTVSTNTIVNNDPANWCLGIVSQKQVTSSVPGAAPLENNVVPTQTVKYVRDSTNLPACRVYQEIVEPTGASDVTMTTTFGYDKFGHQNTQTVSASGILNRVTTTDYGTQGVFPLSLTNAENETVNKSYDYALGVPLTMTDQNKVQQTVWKYDGFGRKILETRADGTQIKWIYTACGISAGYCGDNLLRYQLTEQQLDASGNVIHYGVQYYDAQARVKYTQSQNLSGAMTNVATIYDSLGRIKEQSRPYFTGFAPVYTTIYYDLISRPLTETRPISDSNSGMQQTTYNYAQLTSTRTDANSHATTKQFNALGQIVKVTDPKNGVVLYTYDAMGNLAKTTDAENNQIVNAYNIRGFKKSINDPDLGLTGYTYYPTGELFTQTDAKSQVVTFTYDRVGRQKTRVELEGTTAWAYGTDVTKHEIGKLASVSSPGNYSESYTYDSFGRAQDMTTNADMSSFVVSNSYDPTTGLLDTTTYPTSTAAVANSRFKVKYDYANGILKDVKDFYTPSTIYWQQIAADAAGHVIDEQFGNGLHTYSTFDSVTGLISNRTTGSNANVQSLSYQWNLVGNFTERKDDNLGLTEDFYYDSMDRLDHSTLTVSGTAVTNLTMHYDNDSVGTGSITSKSDVGNYNYTGTQSGCTYFNNSQPHAVRQAGSNTYCYDANGNMMTRNGDALSWYSYDLPNRINQGSNYTQFYYGANRARYKQVAYTAAGGSLPAGTETTVYVGNLMEKVTKPSGVVEYKHYIMAGNAAIAIRTLRTNGANDTRYLHKDHLGSVDTITDENGAVVLRMSFDAFGKRRSSTAWSGSLTTGDWTSIAAITHQAFSGQEQLDNVGLIHMNGRVYDPTIGRFISADPTIQAPFLSQSLNRYSYAINNPLSLTDPTGFTWHTEDWIIHIAQAIFTVAATCEGGPWAGFAMASLFTAEDTLYYDGTFRDFLRAEVINYVTIFIAVPIGKGIGGAVGSAIGHNIYGQIVGGAVGGGVTSGLVSVIAGGSFKKGFMDGALLGAATAVFTPTDDGAANNPTVDSDTIRDAHVASCAYSQPDECDDMPLAKFPNGQPILGNLSSGFKFAAYKDGSLIRVGIAGTDGLSWADWKANIMQAFGFKTTQYQQAIDLAHSLQSSYGDNIVFTGHSLGGGLASAMARATGLRADTFNAAGLSGRYRGDSSSGSIRAYYVGSDALSAFQDAIPGLPSAVGQRIPLSPDGIHQMSGICKALGATC